MNKYYIRPRDLHDAVGYGFDILIDVSLRLSLTIIESTSLRKKRPNLSELPANSFEFHRVNLVT